MLIKFTVKNLFSFKDETEFNLFPNKTTRLPHHKINLAGIDVLRLSSIYGANGSGKSNLIKSISTLKSMISNGKIEAGIESNKFKLSPNCKTLPIEMGIEFYCNSKIYYYELSINQNQVIHEYFAESKKDSDLLIFERKIEKEIQNIKFPPNFMKEDKNKLFVSVLEEKILEKNQLLLSFLGKKYETDFKEVKSACLWFVETLNIISPEITINGLLHILSSNDKLNLLANDMISAFNTGIKKLSVEKKNSEDFFELSALKGLESIIDSLRKDPNSGITLSNSLTKEEIELVNENDKIMIKRLITEHLDENGNQVEFTIPQESDGTKRLLDYIPVIEQLIYSEKVFLIDEIERSIHPLTIKEIILKFSLDKHAKGQLIFTTHESNLLDQDILRTDEIWFSQKEINGASKLYSLSDYKVHNTIDIENGYLNGRYGGIPFLGNLHDLNWHDYSDAK